MASYSLKMIQNVISDSAMLYASVGDPVSIPLGFKVPETLNDQIQKILLGSGAISREAYDAMRGIHYDGDYENGTEPYSEGDDVSDDWDSFVQSNYANYFDEVEPPLITEASPMKTIGEADSSEFNGEAVEPTSDSASASPSEVQQSDRA